MWNFKSTFIIALVCFTVSQNLVKAEDDLLLTCDEDVIDMSLRYLEHHKQVYDIIDMPNFDALMKQYEEVLRDLKSSYSYLVNNCPESNHTYYGEYLERHAIMEECIQGFIQHDDDKELKCLLLKDRSNIDFMVHKVVSNSTEGFGVMMTYCVITPVDLAQQIIIYNALSQELNLGKDNYKKLYFRIRRYIDEVALNAEEHSAFCKVLINLLWSAHRYNPPTAFDEIIQHVYDDNSTFGQKIVHGLVVGALKEKVDVTHILGLLRDVPSESCKIRGYLYINEHFDGYSNPNDIKLQLAYTMKTAMLKENYKEVDPELRSSLSAAYDALPSFAKEFIVSGQICVLIAGIEKQEEGHVFLDSGNQYLFTPKEDGTTTRCDFDEEGKILFHKEAPPTDVTGEMKCEVGDFHPTGEHGVNCSLKLSESNVFACDDARYIVDGSSKYLELRRNAAQQVKSNFEKWNENCVAQS